jgi:hypothetical protein
MTNKSIQRALPGLINGMITLIVAWPVAHRIGVATTIDALTMDGGTVAIAILCLWYAMVFVVLAAILRASAMIFGLRLLSGNDAIDRLGFAIAAPIRKARAAIANAFRLAIATPLRIGLEAIWKPFEDRLFALVNAWDIDRQLRAEYRKSFRMQYRSFAEFKRAFYGQEQKREAPAAAAGTLADALSLLGLASNCTRQELDAQFKALMKKLHPDVGGTDGLAAKLNEAKDTIMKEKGWTK